MQTFDFEKMPIVPPHCLWVSGLLLISGCRADAGLPRLQRVQYPAGNRLAMGEKAPGAWGAPGADPMQKLAAGLASLWAGGNGVGAETAQTSRGSVSLQTREFLLWGAVASPAVPALARNGAEAVLDVEGISQKAPGASEASPISTGGAPVGPLRSAGQDELCKKRVLFIPKPEPWNGTNAGSGTTLGSVRPSSFCRRIVTFTPTPNLVR